MRISDWSSDVCSSDLAGSVSDGGTVSGKVTYSGSVPTKKVIPTKDADVCGSIRDVKLIVVGPGNGVGDAVVFLKDVASGKAWGAPAGVPEIDRKSTRLNSSH